MEAIKEIWAFLSEGPMLGAVVNTLAVIFGAGIGLLFKRGIPEHIGDTIMKGLALCVMMIGVQGIVDGEKPLVTILSVVIGGLIGELCRIDDGLKWLGNFAERKLKKDDGGVSLSEGFVTASLLFIVGAMAVVGSLQSGLLHDHNTTFAKSTLDFVAAIIFASSLGIGVMLSSLAVLLYQGTLSLCAGLLAPVLNSVTINEMSVAGSILIIALSLNMLGITKIKVINYLPAIFLPILLCRFM